MKKRFYYAVLSFMRSDKKGVLAKLPITVSVSKEVDGSDLFPVTSAVRQMEKYAKDFAIPETILVDNVVEISEADYNAYKERAKELEVKSTVKNVYGE